MKVFLSYPMHGRTKVEMGVRRHALENVAKVVYEKDYEDGELEFVDNSDFVPPEGAGRLYCLGEAIKKMDDCDAVIFDPDWWKTSGCKVEYEAARDYGLTVILPGEKGKNHIRIIDYSTNK